MYKRQLYDLIADPAESVNRYADEPSVVKHLLHELKRQVAAGRSTAGATQSNDVPVDIWKLDSMPDVDASLLDDY